MNRGVRDMYVKCKMSLMYLVRICATLHRIQKLQRLNWMFSDGPHPPLRITSPPATQQVVSGPS